MNIFIFIYHEIYYRFNCIRLSFKFNTWNETKIIKTIKSNILNDNTSNTKFWETEMHYSGPLLEEVYSMLDSGDFKITDNLGKNLDYAIVDSIIIPYLQQRYSMDEILSDSLKNEEELSKTL